MVQDYIIKMTQKAYFLNDYLALSTIKELRSLQHLVDLYYVEDVRCIFIPTMEPTLSEHPILLPKNSLKRPNKLPNPTTHTKMLSGILFHPVLLTWEGFGSWSKKF